MKTRLALLLLAAGVTARAQFYAPDTEFHDVAQRMFPVEAARVLAWWKNQSGAGIAEVKFQVRTESNHETAWKISWIDGGGKSVRECAIRYPDGALLRGPEFFRDVFGQLVSDGWKLDSAQAGAAADAFWQGAEAAGVSRMEAFKAASTLVAEKPALKTSGEAFRLAGILSHGAVPMIGSRLTIDGLTVARAAAWLCIGESRSGQKLDAAWTPILFLAGRESLAGTLWNDAAAKQEKTASAAWRFWNLILRKPTVSDAFLFAARKENRQFAMPVMAIFSRMDEHYGRVITQVAQPIFGENDWRRCHDFAPLVAAKGGVAGGHLTGAAANDARRAWIEMLRTLPVEASEVQTLENLLEKTPSSIEADDDELAGFKAAAPLVRLGYSGGVGPLRPVAHLSAQDTLVFGWESELLQLSTRHRFIRGSLGMEDAGKVLAKAIFAVLPGADLIFRKPGIPPELPPVETARLQFVLGSPAGKALAAAPVPLETARLAMKRCWLASDHVGPQVEALARAQASAGEQNEVLLRAHAEGGALGDASMLFYLASSSAEDQLRRLPDREKLMREFVAAVPTALFARGQLAWAEHTRDSNWLAYAEDMERIGWDGLHPIFPSQVFATYIQSHAVQRAKRYYDNVAPFIDDRVSFSNTLGPQRWTLAWLEGDRVVMDRVLQENATFSEGDLTLRVTDAMAREDYARARQFLEVCIQRYGGNQSEKQLLGFMPLIPALKDASHADHGKALDYFAGTRGWMLVQWILADQAGLSLDDKVRFFGGDKAGPPNRMLIAAAREDVAAFDKAYVEGKNDYGNMSFILFYHLLDRLHKVKAPDAGPDPKPASARPLAEMMIEAAK